MKHVRFFLPALLLICFFTADPFCREKEYDRLGGWMQLTSEPKMFFYVQKLDQRWWFIDPAGQGFISKGVNHISYTADFAPALGYNPYGKVTEKKYGNPTRWAKATTQRLREWGFNTIGAWSGEIMRNQEMAYTLILNIGARAGGNWQKGIFPDVFSRKFQQAARHLAQTQCTQRKEDIYLLGYFTDNELRWGADWRSKDSLLLSYLKLKPTSEGFHHAVQFLTHKYKTAQSLNHAWKIKADSFSSLATIKTFPHSASRTADEAEYQERIARQYFSVCRQAIQKYDPNHLILGCRFAGYAPEPVLRGMKDSVDVISYNSYNHTPPLERLQRIHDITEKPILIGEFSFKALDSGLPNTRGAGHPVATQADRAKGFTRYVTQLMQLPYVIGYHWFEYADEPAEGRFDGENSNYGLVNIQDEPWEVLTFEMKKTNRKVENIHRGF